MQLFEPLTDPLAVLPLPKKLYAYVGVSRNPGNRIRSLGFCFYLIAFFFLPKMYLGYDTIPQGFRSIAEGMFGFNTCIPLILLPFNMDQLQELFQGLTLCTKAVSVTEEYKQILIVLNSAIHKYTKHYLIFTIIIIIAMGSSTTVGILYIYNAKDPDEVVSYPLMMEHRMFALNVHHNLLHCFLHQILLLPAIFTLLIAFTAKAGTFFGSIRFCSTILEIITLKIVRLQYVNSTAEYTTQLREIIELHQLVIKCTKILQEILMNILLAQFTGCVLIWCFFLYCVMISGITAEGITVVAMLVSFSTETFIFCLLGNELTMKGGQISTAMYATNWYEQPVKIQKLIIPIVQQSQRRIGITAAKFYYIDVNRYGKAGSPTSIISSTNTFFVLRILPQNMKTAYSFYLLLKDIF
uniref:Uncharacterized protein n=1 Tax=Anopheles dirus TaxID=7168 RepID=A0A182NZ61_9DIPT